MAKNIPHPGPLTFSIPDHERYLKTKPEKFFEEIHEFVLKSLDLHRYYPISPESLLRSVKEIAAGVPESGLFVVDKDNWAIAAHLVRQNRIATSLQVWVTLRESEIETAEKIATPAPLVVSERYGKFLLATSLKGELSPMFAVRPDRFSIAETHFGPSAIAIWDTEYGNPIALSVVEYLFLRTRYPSGQWHLPIDNSRRTPVLITENRRIVAGVMPYDCRTVPPSVHANTKGE